VPSSALITITPPEGHGHYLPSDHICSVIKEHAASTALILLPGVQYYTGQFLDIPKITKFAHELGLTIGWDLAHAAGNVPLSLHDWDVDFAAWCSYKYLNSGPGSIGGLFVHERHGKVETGPNVPQQPLSTPLGDPSEPSNAINQDSSSPPATLSYRPRLSGWWGHDKSSRFIMGPDFVPIPGASGFQVSNPSVYDITSVLASLSVFDKTTMPLLRQQSLKLTAYLEKLLLEGQKTKKLPYRIITPSNPEERGAQISVILEPNLLDVTMEVLEREGVVVDERKPDVIRIAPAPLYNTFKDVLTFYHVFEKALGAAVEQKGRS
jgi:kynureninase